MGCFGRAFDGSFLRSSPDRELVVLMVAVEFVSGLVVGMIANFIVAGAFGGKGPPLLSRG